MNYAASVLVKPYVHRVLDVARGEIGVREIIKNGHGTNRGRRVDEYQNADLLPGVGYAWCGSYWGWNMLTALGQPLCDRVWLRSASCDSILDWARRRDILSSEPAPGCAGLVMASKYDATHIFGVEEERGSELVTLEGNTNLGGSREGIGVFRRTRKKSRRYLFVHWPNLLPRGASLPDIKTPVPPKVKPASPFAGAPLWGLWSDDEKRTTMPNVQGRNYIEAWRWAAWMKGTRDEPDLSWNIAAQSVSINGVEIPAQPILANGRAWLPIITLAETFGRPLVVDAKSRKVYIQ